MSSHVDRQSVMHKLNWMGDKEHREPTIDYIKQTNMYGLWILLTGLEQLFLQVYKLQINCNWHKFLLYCLIINVSYKRKTNQKSITEQLSLGCLKLVPPLFFSVQLLSVLWGHSFFHPRHNGQWPPTLKDFLSQILSITFIFLS